MQTYPLSEKSVKPMQFIGEAVQIPKDVMPSVWPGLKEICLATEKGSFFLLDKKAVGSMFKFHKMIGSIQHNHSVGLRVKCDKYAIRVTRYR